MEKSYMVSFRSLWGEIETVDVKTNDDIHAARERFKASCKAARGQETTIVGEWLEEKHSFLAKFKSYDERDLSFGGKDYGPSILYVKCDPGTEEAKYSGIPLFGGNAECHQRAASLQEGAIIRVEVRGRNNSLIAFSPV